MLRRDRVHRCREGLLGVEQDRRVEQPGIARARLRELGRVLEDDDRSRTPRPRVAPAADLVEHLQRNGVPIVRGHGVEVADPAG